MNAKLKKGMYPRTPRCTAERVPPQQSTQKPKREAGGLVSWNPINRLLQLIIEYPAYRIVKILQSFFQ